MTLSQPVVCAAYICHNHCCHSPHILWTRRLSYYCGIWLSSWIPQTARFMRPTWDPHGANRTQVGPMLAPWTLLSGHFSRLGQCLYMTVHFVPTLSYVVSDMLRDSQRSTPIDDWCRKAIEILTVRGVFPSCTNMMWSAKVWSSKWGTNCSAKISSL